jgi:delta 1-pyrroline-5-carboxylate dehydrogenase
MARKYGLIILVGFLGAALLAAEANAQPQGGGRGARGMGGMGPGGGGMGLLMLVQNEKVQKELEIVDDQKTKLTELSTEQRTAMRDMFTSMQDLSQEERQTKMQEMQDKFQKKLADILLPKQLERLKEIQLQAEGPMALANPDIAKALNLTSEQQDKVKAIRDEAQAKVRELFTGMQDLSQEERRAKMTEMQTKMQTMTKELGDKLLTILTPDQVAQFDKMKGAKVDIDFSTLMRGNRGNRGGAGGPPPGGPPPGGN